MAMGHVILREFYFDGARCAYFDDYVRRYSDLPMLVRLCARRDHCVPGPTATRGGLRGQSGEANNPDWKTMAFDAGRQSGPATGRDRLPLG